MRHRSLSHVRHAAVFLAIAGCATPSSAQDLEAAKRDAGRAYIACLHTAALRLDDGRSEASSIGIGVAGACTGERHAYAMVAGRGVYQLERGMQERLDNEAQDRATAIVLAERARRRAR